jgi:HD-like signal output (HDOD) protein
MRNTVQSILAICSNEKATSKELADTIIKDPTFTIRVIRIANCLYYKRTSAPIMDIRQAVLLIGFDKILAICLTVSIVDKLVNNNTLRHIRKLMKCSLQTALLAKSIAENIGLPHPDDLFIAGLLHDIGEIAFWSLSGQSGDEIANKLANIPLPDDAAQRELLGITFKELTIGITTRWRLCPILRLALIEPNILDPYVQCLIQSHNIALEYGNNNASNIRLHELSKTMKLSIEDTAALVKEQYIKSLELSECYLSRP